MHFENWLNVQMHRAKVKNEHCKGGIFGLAQQSIVLYSFILGREGNYIHKTILHLFAAKRVRGGKKKMEKANRRDMSGIRFYKLLVTWCIV